MNIYNEKIIGEFQVSFVFVVKLWEVGITSEEKKSGKALFYTNCYCVISLSFGRHFLKAKVQWNLRFYHIISQDYPRKNRHK